MTDPVAIGDELLADYVNGIATVFEIEVFTTAGTWIKQEGCMRIMVDVIGGGGTGGGTAATGAGQSANSGGGGGGGYARKLFLTSDLANSETVDVGAGGTPPAAGNNTGGTGGTSRFATSKGYVVTANGGAGGAGSPASGGPAAVAGGQGGTATGGTINRPGSDGGPGQIDAAAGNNFVNCGGSSFFGGITYPPIAAGSGRVGKVYGGGSSGAIQVASSAALAPLAGGAGIVIVYNFF